MQVIHPRGPLAHTRAAIERGSLHIGFIGGSISAGETGYSWPEYVIPFFLEAFPRLRISVENAAIGATGSDLAVFRAQRDLIDRGCDVVFVEFAVNDSAEPSPKRLRTREGLVRKLLAGGKCDVVHVYTFGQNMYEEMMAGRVPDTIAEFEQLGEHYGLPSVWMGLHALRELQAGKMRWETWLPDGVHPQHLGSQSYAASVVELLRGELTGAAKGSSGPRPLPAPMDPLNWERAGAIPLETVETEGPWVLRRWPFTAFIDQVLDTSAVGAKLRFAFRGRVLCLAFDFARTSCEIRWRIDAGPWATTKRDRFDWVGLERGWFRLSCLADDLPPGSHTFEMEVVHGNRPGCLGTTCRLALIGVVP